MGMITAIYARQSLEKKDSLSMETQIDFCKKVLSDNETVEVFTDQGYSGKNIERPAFQQMMRQVENGDINKVIVYKLDRISRSVLDFANLMETFRQHHVTFQSTQEQFDTATPMGNAMLNVTMVFAQLERETIQQRVTDNYYARGKKGFFLGGVTPFGYEKISTIVNGKKTKTLQPHPAEAEIITELFHLYGNQNQSLGEIARTLNRRNIPGIRKTSWDSVRVSMRLRNPVYVAANADVYHYYARKGCVMDNDVSDYTGDYACYLWGKRRANDRKYNNLQDHHISLCLHKGFIDADLFLQCQYKLDHNTQVSNSGRGKYTWLSGLIKCSFCGRAMTAKHYKHGSTEKFYLSCSGVSAGICDCLPRSHDLKRVEQSVKERLFQLIRDHKNLADSEPNRPDLLSQYSNLQKIQLAKIDAQIENLVKEVACGNPVVTKYLLPELERLEAEKTAIQNASDLSLQFPGVPHRIMHFCDLLELWDFMNLEDQKTIAALLIDKVTVGADTIQIYWKHNFDKEIFVSNRI